MPNSDSTPTGSCSLDPPHWLRRLDELRPEFQRRADDRPKLRHVVIQPLTPKMRMPARMAAHMQTNLNQIRKCEIWDWRGVSPERIVPPELAYLYGPHREVAEFDRIAEQAWLALPPGQEWDPPSGEPSDGWLWFVYEALRKELPNYFFWDRVLQVVSIPNVPGVEGNIYTFEADREAEADESRWQGLPRFRQTSLRVDPFAASAAAIAVASENLIQAVLSGQPAATDAPALTAAQDARRTPAPTPAIPPGELASLLSAADLARALQQPVARVETFLRRYRGTYPDCCTEVEEGGTRRNESRYLYRVADVWPALQQRLSKWRNLTDG